MTESIKQRSPEIEEQLARRAGAIATFVGGDYGMTVGVGPEGSGWHWDFEKNHVNMDAHDLLYESEEVLRGVASHEGNHRIASRAEHVQDMWREPGFSFGYNAVEDPRVNTAGMSIMPGTRPWIKAYIEKDLSEGGGLNYQHMTDGAEQKLGYVPAHMKWGAEMIRYWYEKEFSGTPLDAAARQAFLDQIPDESVRGAVEKTIDDFEKYYQTIPSSRDETEVQRKAAESAAAFKNHIWPEYQKLVEQAYDDQAAADMLQDMIDGQEGGASGGSGTSGDKNSGGSTISIPFESLPQDVQDEIRQKMSSQQQSGGQSGQSGSQPGEQAGEGVGQSDNQSGGQQGGESDGSSQAEGQTGGQAGESGAAGSPQNQQGSSAGGGEGDSQGGASGGGSPDQNMDSASQSGQSGQGSKNGPSTGRQVPWDQLSDQAKEAVRQAFSNLDQDSQDAYKQQAQEELEGVEDEANEKLRGKMTDPRDNETKQETREREAREAEAAAQAQEAADTADRQQQERRRQQEVAQMIQSMQRRRERAVRDLPENTYQTFLNDPEVRTALIELDNDFRQIFTPNEIPGTRYTYAGLRPSMPRAMQFEADPRRSNIFESKGRPREKSHRFLWSGDLSSSMSGIVDLVFKAVVIDVELANKHGLESAVIGFSSDGGQEDVMVFKDFEPKRLTRQGRDRLGTMPSSGGGGTPLYQATEFGYHMLKQRNSQVPMKNNYFQTYTDGGPTDATPQDLAELVKRLRKDREIITSGFGIGPGTGYVDEIYPQLPKPVREAIARKIHKSSGDISNSFDNVIDFARAFVVIMRFQVEHPELFYE